MHPPMQVEVLIRLIRDEISSQEVRECFFPFRIAIRWTLSRKERPLSLSGNDLSSLETTSARTDLPPLETTSLLFLSRNDLSFSFCLQTTALFLSFSLSLSAVCPFFYCHHLLINSILHPDACEEPIGSIASYSY